MPVAVRAPQALAHCAAGAERHHVRQRAGASTNSGHPCIRGIAGSCCSGILTGSGLATSESGFQQLPEMGFNKSGGAAHPPAASAAGRLWRTRGIDDGPVRACHAPAPECALAHRFGAGEFRQSVYPVNLPLELIGGIQAPGAGSCPGACFLEHAPGSCSWGHRLKSPRGHGRRPGRAHADRRAPSAKPARPPPAAATPRAIRALRCANVQTTARRRSTLALREIGDAAAGGVPVPRQSEPQAGSMQWKSARATTSLLAARPGYRLAR